MNFVVHLDIMDIIVPVGIILIFIVYAIYLYTQYFIEKIKEKSKNKKKNN